MCLQVKAFMSQNIVVYTSINMNCIHSKFTLIVNGIVVYI